MELIMLGTGYAMARKCYNTCFAIKNDETTFLVDAGGGNKIFDQIDSASIKYDSIKSMFITHCHTDHILGAIWMVRMMGTLMDKKKYNGLFHVYGHNLVIEALESICKMTLPAKFIKKLGKEIILHIVEEGDSAMIAGMDVTFFDIASTKAKQFGFRAVLPEGDELVCLGDEPFNPVCRKYVNSPKWMLSEAFCLYNDREIFHPYEKHHSTALDAGKLAQELDVKNLVLYHTEDKTLDTRKENYTKEAKSVFGGNVFVPEDMEIINL